VNRWDEVDDDDADWDEDPAGDDDESDEDEPTLPCPYCRREIHEEAERCPYCDHYISDEDRRRAAKPWWLVASVAVCLILVLWWIAAG
jgi:hypothetical protein